MSDYRKLGDVSFAVKDKVNGVKDANLKYIGLEHLDSSSSYLNGYAEPSVSISTNSVFRSGDTIFGKLRPNLRKSVLAPFDGYCSTDLLVLRSADDVVPEYAARVFQSESVFRCAEETAVGTKMPRTSWAQLRQLKVFCPERAEQKTIAKILDTLDTQIRQTKAIIAKLQQVKQGLLHDLLARGIDANGQLRPPRDQAPDLYKESPLGWIPREWEVKSLVELSVGGLMNGVFKEPSRVGEGVPLVNVADLYRGEKVLLENCECFDATQEEQKRYGARKGDIFFTRSSLKLEGIAQTSYLDVDSKDAVFECHVIRLRPNRGLVLPRLLKEWCVSSYARKHFMKSAKQVTMTTISQDGIAGLHCPQPPEYEQRKIVELIENNEARLLREHSLVEKLKKQKSGLMDDLLTGRVRVNQLIDTAKAS